MTREEAKAVIIELINSNDTKTKHIDPLYEMLHCICDDSFEECEGSDFYCGECPFRAEK